MWQRNARTYRHESPNLLLMWWTSCGQTTKRLLRESNTQLTADITTLNGQWEQQLGAIRWEGMDFGDQLRWETAIRSDVEKQLVEAQAFAVK